eukprot:2003695-Rhodomonas_salina.2
MLAAALGEEEALGQLLQAGARAGGMPGADGAGARSLARETMMMMPSMVLPQPAGSARHAVSVWRHDAHRQRTERERTGERERAVRIREEALTR